MQRCRWQTTCLTTGTVLRLRRYLRRLPGVCHSTMSGRIRRGWFSRDKIYVVQTSTKVIERCLLMTTDPGDLVLDPTCGSGTTAYVAEQWGRRWITMRHQPRCAGAGTHPADGRQVSLLPAGRLARGHAEGSRTDRQAAARRTQTEGDIRKGFVYKRVPHVTLKSIANNPDIKEGMTREEIDAAIARHAETRDALRPAVRGQQERSRVRARSRSKASRRTASFRPTATARTSPPRHSRAAERGRTFAR